MLLRHFDREADYMKRVEGIRYLNLTDSAVINLYDVGLEIPIDKVVEVDTT